MKLLTSKQADIEKTDNNPDESKKMSSLKSSTSTVKSINKLHRRRKQIRCTKPENTSFGQWKMQASKLVISENNFSRKTKNNPEQGQKMTSSFKSLTTKIRIINTLAPGENNLEVEKSLSASDAIKPKKIKAKVDCRRRNNHFELFEEWRIQRASGMEKWNQKQTLATNDNTKDVNVRIFACIIFNKCTVLYTHAN